MAVTLNLIPPGRAVSGPLGKILKTVRMLNVILLLGFIIFSSGLGIYFAYTSIQLKGILSDVETLKSQIVAEEKTEQALSLLKDRIAKITLVRRAESFNSIFSKIEPFLANIGPNSSLSEMDIDPQKMDLSVTFRSNSDLSDFLKSIRSSDVFKSITLTNFGYNPSNGYLATFHIL